MRSVGLYQKSDDQRRQLKAVDGASGLDEKPGVRKSKSDATTPEEGCKETLRHESLRSLSSPFFATASEPSYIPLRTIVIEKPHIEEDAVDPLLVKPPIEKRSVDSLFVMPPIGEHAMDTFLPKDGVESSSVELELNLDNAKLEFIPEWCTPSLPDDILSARFHPKSPSSVALNSGYCIAVLYCTL